MAARGASWSAVRDALLQLRIESATRVRPSLQIGNAEVDVWRDRDGDVVAEGSTVAGRHWIHLPGFATYSFAETRAEITATPAPGISVEAVRDWHRRFVLPMALQALGFETLHASGVVASEGVIAFCGLPRTGKSTVAYGLHRRGYALWADDSVVLHAVPTIETIPLPFRIRLRPTACEFFGADGGQPPDLDGLSTPCLMHADVAPLAAVFVLIRNDSGQGGAGLRVRGLPPAAAFHAVLGHALCFSLRNRERKRRMLEFYLALADQTRVFEVRFEPGFEKLSAILDAIEQAISGLGCACP